MKTSRQTTIRELILKSPVLSQDALRHKLAARGIHVTQATLSRDIRALGLIKTAAGYTLPASTPADDAPALADVLASFGVSTVAAQNQVLVHTTLGGAQPVAAAIDHARLPKILGTIAGDDTVLIICPTARDSAALRQRLVTMLS